MSRASLFDIAGRPAPESLSFELDDAQLRSAKGEPLAVKAGVTLTRASITVTAGAPAGSAPDASALRAVETIAAASGAWEARGPSYAGPSTAVPAGHRFGATRLLVTDGEKRAVAATRAVFAGAAWAADVRLDGREVLIRPLSSETANYEDERIGATIEGEATEPEVLTLRRLISFIAGTDVQLLAVGRYDEGGRPIEVEHRRDRPKIGSSTHSPFRGVGDAARAAAAAVLCEAFERRGREGFPLDRIVDLAVRSNGGGIHIGAQLHAMAIETTVNYLSEARNDTSPRRSQYERINVDLHLGLDAAALDRLLGLREELLRRGYFHREYRSQQVEIKFLRDIAHTIVLRLCSYSGPYYDSEHSRVVELADAPLAV